MDFSCHVCGKRSWAARSSTVVTYPHRTGTRRIWTTNDVLSLRLCKVSPNLDEVTILTSSLLFYLVSSSVIPVNFIFIRYFSYYIL